MRNKKSDIETNFEVRSFDLPMSFEQYNALPKLPLYIVLDNLRSAFNVGAIFRVCDTLRVKGLFLCGYTAYPPHKKLEKTSLGTIDFVPWRHFDATEDAVAWLKAHNVPLWAAETTSVSENYLTADYPDELAIVLGNEALGVGEEVMKKCNKLIEIPLYGYKNSLNVATACAVLGFKFAEMKMKKPLQRSSM